MHFLPTANVHRKRDREQRPADQHHDEQLPRRDGVDVRPEGAVGEVKGQSTQRHAQDHERLQPLEPATQKAAEGEFVPAVVLSLAALKGCGEDKSHHDHRRDAPQSVQDQIMRLGAELVVVHQAW